MFDIRDTGFEGLKIIRPLVRPDDRGRFVKLVHKPDFAEAGLLADFPEQYVTTSWRGVLRGMHFQLPPHDHVKLVYCVAGKVLDAALDLRPDSVTYGQAFSIELDGESASGMYIPRGFAHGFLTLTDVASLHYLVETVHAPDFDAGIRWDSFGFDWPVNTPNVSKRDSELPALHQIRHTFNSHSWRLITRCS